MQENKGQFFSCGAAGIVISSEGDSFMSLPTMLRGALSHLRKNRKNDRNKG